MKIKVMGLNQTVVYTKNLEIFFSYETPVVIVDGLVIYKTDKFFSNTTFKHIKNFLREYDATIRTVSQTTIERMVDEECQ